MVNGFSDDELQEFHRIIQAAALAAYPNPERVGCPGRHVLREIANTPRPFEHVCYEHVVKCSPCLREMLDFRSEFVKSRKKKKRLLAAAAVALAIVAGVTGTFLIDQIRSGPSKQVASQGVEDVSGLPDNSISLTPNFLRGKPNGQPNTLTISSARSVALLLNLENDSYPFYDVVIQTENGKVLTTFVKLKSVAVRTGRAVFVRVSSDLFDRGNYTLILRGEATKKGKTQVVNLYQLVVK